MDELKPCARCGELFAAKSGHVRYCSDACKKLAVAERKHRKWEEEKAARKRPDVPCVICGTLFAPRNRVSKYCSDACRREAVRHCYDKYRDQEPKADETPKTEKKPKAVPPKPRKKPAVSIEEVCRFEAEYHRLHGVWLGYHGAKEKMREMGYRVGL